MFRIILTILFIFSFNFVYSQKRGEVQKYIYQAKPLTIEVESHTPYHLNKNDTIKVSVKFTNNSYDTIFIHTFQNVKKYENGFTISFLNSIVGSMDWADTLLMLGKETEIKFNFIMPAKDFYSEKFDYSFIELVLKVGYVLSIDTLRKHNFDKQKFQFENQRLIINYSKIEICSQTRELIAFCFRLNK